MTIWTVPAVVLSVHDGDTAKLALDLGWRISLVASCRVHGINAPELNTAEGIAARDYARTLLPEGTPVTFVSHSLDKYGRPLGDIIHAGDRSFGEAMIAAGHAVPYMV